MGVAYERLTENSMFFLSWLTALGSGTGSVCLSTETDSPVRMDWSTLRVVERMDVSLMSAGTLSPTRDKQRYRVQRTYGYSACSC